MDITKLNADELDTLINAALKRRVELKAGAVEPRPTEKVEAVHNPAWHVTPAQVGTILQIHHPLYGWVGFIVPPAERATLLGFLLQQALIPIAAPTQDAAAITPLPSAGFGGGTLH